jgi:aarF domain-containing kinase
MARDYYVLDFLTPDVDVSPIVPALRGFFDDVLSLSVQELNFKTIVDGLGALYYDYPFTGGRRFVSTGQPLLAGR